MAKKIQLNGTGRKKASVAKKSRNSSSSIRLSKTSKEPSSAKNLRKIPGNVLLIPEDLTIASITKLKKLVEQKLQSNSELSIVGSEAKAIDLTGVQLLFAIKKLAEDHDRKINFNISTNKETSLLLGKAGFNLQKLIS
jgi:hypothetical protein